MYGRDYTLSVDLPAMGSRMYRITPEAPHPEAAQASARKAAAQKRKATIAAKQNSKSNIAFKISRLLKCRRDILSSGACPLPAPPGTIIL